MNLNLKRKEAPDISLKLSYFVLVVFSEKKKNVCEKLKICCLFIFFKICNFHTYGR